MKAVNNYVGISTPFATVTGDKVLNTGVQEVTTYNGLISRVSAGYYALMVGNKILIVKSPKLPPTTVTGSLDPMPYDLKTQLLSSDVNPAVRAQVYPLPPLDTKYREPGFIAIFWGLLAEVIFGFFGVALLDAADRPPRASGGYAGEGLGRPCEHVGWRRAGVAEFGEVQEQGLDAY